MTDSQLSSKIDLSSCPLEAPNTLSDLGQAFLTVAGQIALVTAVFALWIGRDLSYTPGWPHPIAFYFGLAGTAAFVLCAAGLLLHWKAPKSC